MPVLIPHSVDEATAMLRQHPGAHLLTGGTDLMVEVNFNHRRPETVIALRSVPELRQWRVDPARGTVWVGAGVPYAQMERGELANVSPALAAAARTVGSPQIRAAGTLGGNLGTCSPAGDSLPVLFALDATVHLASDDGVRDLPVADFMTGPKRNARTAAEIIVGITLPVAQGFQGYAKVGVRNAMVISVASACLAVQSGHLRLALGSVGPTILRCTDTEAWFASLPPETRRSPDVIREFADRAAAEARPIDDHRSTAQYRRHAIGVLARRLLERSLAS